LSTLYKKRYFGVLIWNTDKMGIFGWRKIVNVVLLIWKATNYFSKGKISSKNRKAGSYSLQYPG